MHIKGGFHLHLGWNIARALQVEMVIWKCIETNFKLRRSGPGKKIASFTISRKSNFSICQWQGRRSEIHKRSKFEAVFFLRPILKIVGDFRVCDNQEEWLLPIGQSEELEFTTNHNFEVDSFFLKNLIVESFLATYARNTLSKSDYWQKLVEFSPVIMRVPCTGIFHLIYIIFQ